MISRRDLLRTLFHRTGGANTSSRSEVGADTADPPSAALPTSWLSSPTPSIEEAGRALRSGRTERLEKLFAHLSRFGAASLNPSETGPSGMKEPR